MGVELVLEELGGGGRVYRYGDQVLPSVTTILSATKDQSGLDAWRQRVGEKEAERIRQAAADRGTALHDKIERHLRGEEISSDCPWWGSIVGELSFVADPILIETPVCFPEHGYAGTVDCVAMATNGAVVVYDWKTAGKPKRKEWIGDYLLQVSAYAKAVAHMGLAEPEFGVVAIALEGKPAQVYGMDWDEMDQNFKAFLARVESYRWLDDRQDQGA